MLKRCGVIALGTMVILAGAVVAEAQQATLPSFEVTVVKPARPDAEGEDWDSNEATTIIRNYPLIKLIRAAYDLKSTSQVVDAPEWMTRERFDVTAKVDAQEFRKLNALGADERTAEFGALLRSMLAERFGLRVTQSTRRMPIYAMERISATSLGAALKPVPAGPDGRPVGGQHSSRNGGHWEAVGESMEQIAALLSARYEMGGRVVMDRTATPGYFAFTFDYAPDRGTGVPPEAALPGLADAVRQDLGLKLVKTEGPVPVVVVVSAAKPDLD